MVIICLNMIVKNESKIITRLFESIKNIFDTYCICDTGSTDNTPDIIKVWMKNNNKKGFVIHEPFKDFGYNRTHGILEAQKKIAAGELRGDYFLFLDADMKLVITEKFVKSKLTANAYTIIQKSPMLSYYNVRFIKTSCKATSMGVTHEYYDIPEGGIEKMDDTFIYINDIGDGGAKNDKVERDIRLLTNGINDASTPEGLKARYHFYRANTYFDTNQHDKAIEDYKKRIEIGGWIEEVWYSKYHIAMALERKGMRNEATIAYLAAYQHHPKRAESLYELVRMNREIGQNNIAYAFYQIAKQIPYPKDDVLFINRNVYEFLLDYEITIIGFYTNHPDTDKIAIRLINKNKGIDFKHIMSNYKFYCKNIPMVSVFDFTDNSVFAGFSSSTPCIFPGQNREYNLLVRHHNYKINNDGSYACGDKVTSNYSIITLNKSLEKTSTIKIDEPPITDNKYIGIEDVKMFKFNDSLYFMGTAQHHKTGNLTIAFGKRELIPSKNKLKYWFMPSPECRNCEKNWAFFSTDKDTLRIVYEWDNFKTYKVGENSLSDFTTLQTPPFFRHLRGSSNGFKYGECIWFVCHLVNFENRRFYYHVIVVYNYKTNTFAYTVPFKFEGKPVEYSLGLIVEENRLLISYSTEDVTSKVAVIDKREVCKLFV